MKAYTHVTGGERIRIEMLRFGDHETIRQVARQLHRSASTISRELRRGLWFASNENESYRPYHPGRLKTGAWTAGPFYSALTVQREAEARSRRPRKPRRMMDARLHAWVADALHRLVEEALGMLTYYADPYSPWQRASNENRNGMIRRYLPKHTSLKNLTQTELDDIVTEINDTPMKLLDYHTPNEAWQEEISKLGLSSNQTSQQAKRCTYK